MEKLLIRLFVVSLVFITAMAITAIRLDLNGVGVDDVFDLLVTGGFVVVTSVVGSQVPLGVVTVTALVLAVVIVIIIVLYMPVQFVMGCVLLSQLIMV